MAAREHAERRRRRPFPPIASGQRSRMPLVLVALGGLLLFTLPMLLPSHPQGERLKIRRELRKF
ncbi:hypothetical protein NZK32_15295 [Cyanobium sp. FGCU-52]|nr:hypothetical protein [Cyanobium sp. FGCU52]